MEIRTLFENAHFLAVDKPSGMLSVLGRIGVSDPRPCLSQHLREGRTGVFPVHRLDVEVSGIVLFAKDVAAHREANRWFESRNIHKYYEAWTEGFATPTAEPLEWSSKLLRGKKRAYESEHGKLAVTRAWLTGEQKFRDARLMAWRLEPLTGRAHQLRVHLAQHGYPILGDVLYGAKLSFLKDTIGLRAVALDFSSCPGAKKFDLPQKIAAPGLSEVLDCG